MKKCASCTKDLPDAALHCVFCGAKQAPSPAISQAANAKTVMGYGGQELEALRAQAAAANAARGGGAPPSGPSPYGQPPPNAYGVPPQASNASTMLSPPAAQPPSGYGAPQGYGGPQQGYGGPQQGYGAPQGGGYGGPQGGGYGAPQGGYAPQPIAPVASAVPPYLASETAARAGRPIEPWKDTLHVMLFIWGGLLLAAFATPVSISPLAFNWDAIINGEGTAKLPPLMLAAIGALSIAIGAIPMPTPSRGALAMVLGLAGIWVPVLIVGVPPWQQLVAMVGVTFLVPCLFVRNEYRDASLPRILITVFAIAALLPLLLPVNGKVPLVALFQGMIDAPGKAKVLMILVLGQVVIVGLSLLAWLPSPSSGAAKPLAWLLLMWPFVLHVAAVFLVGNPEIVTDTPYAGVMSWLAGGGAVGGIALGVGYHAIASFGTATVLGKQLE